MSLRKKTLPSGFTLPSIHSLHPFFNQQPNPQTHAEQMGHWTRLILSYARHTRLFALRVEDAELRSDEWAPVLTNSDISRSLKASHLEAILTALVAQGKATWDPPRQTRSVMLLWRSVDEWADALFEWASSTGQLNTILTYYEIQEPELPSALTGIPTPLLQRAIQALIRSGRAQIIEGAEGGGVRLFAAR
ncbi:ESCRT-II complex, vps25 subunit [Auriculariales sp. MPI-PUGE-AT-0066]|nr:ESCRT-II complex, vps25 subunit [Auriculariales sp. MPI-PUGE-AT-0066]